jgi:predicted outer membrane protein
MLLIPVSHALADVASSDKTFVEKAAQGGMTEVEAGKLAQEKASSHPK